MKKLLSVLLALVMVLSLLPMGVISVSAASSGITGDCMWKLDSNGVLTISGEGEMDEYRYSAGGVALPWGWSITEVIIKSGVTNIGSYAFYECTKLKKVTIPDSVTSIGENAFYECTKLKKVTIPDNVTSIGNYAFYKCDSLLSVTIPDSVMSIGTYAFSQSFPLLTIYGAPSSTAEIYAIEWEIPFEKKILSIEATLPKLTYLESKDVLNVSSGTLTLCYNKAKTNREEINLAEAVVRGFDNASVGTQTLTITYQGFTTTLDVEVVPKSLLSIALITNPSKCTYIEGKDDLSVIGGKIIVIYDNGDVEIVDITADMVSGFDITKAGQQTLAVAYKGKTTTFDVTVNHAFAAATCTDGATCSVCGTAGEAAKGHKFSTATCTAPKTCTVCGVTDGTAAGHKFSAATCTAASVCSVCKTVGAAATGHSYKTTTTKATLSKDGSKVTKCSVCGTQASKSTIKKIKTVKLSATAYTYDGKAKSPSVAVKDSAGKTLKKNTDYTVTYAKGRKNVGTYKVTVTFKGNYSGKKVLTFKINPPKTTVNKLTAAKKSLKVTISKKTTQVTGYEVQYATSKSFKSAKTKTIKSAKTTSLTIKSLKAKKTYYVRVRTYKTVSGKKYYSAWSAAKSKKTK